MQGARKEGLPGLVKGALKGVTGLVVKPIAGSLDAVSKVSEGVSNTFDSKQHITKSEKYRLPRVFYGSEGIIKNYLEYDALAQDIIRKYKSEKYFGVHLDWMEGFHLHYQYSTIIKNKPVDRHIHLHLVLTIKRIFLVNFMNNTLTWKFKVSAIDRVAEHNTELAFYLRKKSKMLKVPLFTRLLVVTHSVG